MTALHAACALTAKAPHAQEYERMVDSVPAEARALLQMHLADLEARLRPGELVLTWASLNVDGFLQSLQQARPCTLPRQKYTCIQQAGR